jgi:hypothetical protein
MEKFPRLKIRTEEMTVDKINELFSATTESKYLLNMKLALEKSNRRVISIIQKHELIKERIDVVCNFGSALYILNKQLSKKIPAEVFKKAYEEITALYITLKDMNIDIYDKAALLLKCKMPAYTEVTRIFHFNSYDSSALSRLKNIHKTSVNFISGRMDIRAFVTELDEQICYFTELCNVYANAGKNRLFVYLIRYDFKTLNKKTKNRL